MRIEPTIGRIVWFFAPVDDGRHADGQPFSAMVAGVNDDGTVNLMVAARDGSPYGAQNVPLLQDDDAIDQDTAHAVWMPYQKGQAAKTEQLQAAGGGIDAGVTDKLAELQKTFNDTITDRANDVDAKFASLGDWLTPALEALGKRIDALNTPAQTPPAQPDPVAQPQV